MHRVDDDGSFGGWVYRYDVLPRPTWAVRSSNHGYKVGSEFIFVECEMYVYVCV